MNTEFDLSNAQLAATELGLTSNVEKDHILIDLPKPKFVHEDIEYIFDFATLKIHWDSYCNEWCYEIRTTKDHPHAIEEEENDTIYYEICLNDWIRSLDKYLKEKDWLQFITMAIFASSNYTPSGATRRLGSVQCPECGCWDYLHECTACGEKLCEDCMTGDLEFCTNCAEACDLCDDVISKDETYYCQHCGYRYCKDCLSYTRRYKNNRCRKCGGLLDD